MIPYFMRASCYNSIRDQLTSDERETIRINIVSHSVQPKGYTIDSSALPSGLFDRLTSLLRGTDK